MTLHMIQGVIATDSGMTESDVQTAIDDWVAARTKWEEAPPTEVTRRSAGPLGESGTEYFGFTVRFEWSADKDNTLQKAADKFKNKVDWFPLAYHVCDHDEDDRAGCEWSERWDWTGTGISLPSDIEQLLPDSADVTMVSA